MKITSPAFENNQMIPEKYTCDGDNINPQLVISDTPKIAKSLLLVIDDPDAPIGIFHHWIVYNIASDTTTIEENSVPEGAVQLKNDFGNANYGGPCPGTGDHRYFFKVYALDQKLDLLEDFKLKDLGEKINGHVLDNAQLIGIYHKK